MNRPWTACAVMLIAMGGSLASVGSANRPTVTPAGEAVQSDGVNSQVVYCGSTVPRTYRYEEGCGFDRTSGTQYSQPTATRAWSMIQQMHFEQAMASISRAKNGPDPRNFSHGDAQWPAVAVNVVHPSAPSFYQESAARDYALAQGQAWRTSSDPLMLQGASRFESDSILRLELCPPNTFSTSIVQRASELLDGTIRGVRRYPIRHNVRITVLALENRTVRWSEGWLQTTTSRLAVGGKPGYPVSASSVGLEPGEYEELVERALEKMPVPEKTDSPPHFRPAPSRQKLLRMASASLQALSELLDTTAGHLERVAAGEVATRNQPSTR